MSLTQAKFVFTCGGTGGHIYPLIALAQCYSREDVVFIGSEDREDTHIIPKYGFEFHSISVKSAYKKSYITGIRQSLSILRKVKPSCVVSSGGYLTFSVVIAARLLRIPVVILEQNTIPGRVNRLLAHVSKHVFLSFEESRSFFSKTNTQVVGNPVRKVFLRNEASDVFKSLRIKGKRVWLVFGGSQGAEAINSLIMSQFNYFITGDDVLILITGRDYFEKYFPNTSHKVLYSQFMNPHVILFPYFESMDLLYKQADIVIGRSGATTIAEVIYFNKPAIFIPFPYSKDNHQVRNAEVFCSLYPGHMILEKNLSFSTVLNAVQTVMASRKQENKQPENPVFKIKEYLDLEIG